MEIDGLLTQSYAFAATNSAGTPVQIAAPNVAGYSVNSYLVTNIGSTEGYIRLASSSAGAAQVLPSPSGGNSIPFPASSSRIVAGIPGAYFNAQTASGSTNFVIAGVLTSI